MKSDKYIFLFIGPKGAGKSFLGALFQQHFGIKFVRVEDWAKEIKRERAIDDTSYLADVFSAIESGIRSELERENRCSFESTGLTIQFDKMLSSLRKDFTVITVGVDCSDELCLLRVKTRDQSIHINVSDDEVQKINKLVKEKNFQCDYTISNHSDSKSGVLKQFSEILAGV